MASEDAPIVPELFVSDVAASVAFYPDRLGFHPLRVEWDFAVMALGEAVLFLAAEASYAEPLTGTRGRGIDVRVMVTDVDAYHDRVDALDVEIVVPIGDRDYGMRDFIIRDRDGYRLRFGANLPAPT